jgi:hypothetical protein
MRKLTKEQILEKLDLFRIMEKSDECKHFENVVWHENGKEIFTNGKFLILKSANYTKELEKKGLTGSSTITDKFVNYQSVIPKQLREKQLFMTPYRWKEFKNKIKTLEKYYKKENSLQTIFEFEKDEFYFIMIKYLLILDVLFLNTNCYIYLQENNPYEKSFKLEFENFENDIAFICMPMSRNAFNIESDFSYLQELTCKFTETDVRLVCNKLLNKIKLTAKEKNVVEFFTNPSLWNCDGDSDTWKKYEKWQEIIENNMKK